MRSKKGPVALIVAGCLLGLGPVWGLLGTVIGMVHAFGTLNETGPGTPQRLASDISTSLCSTAAGIIMAPLGLALVVAGVVWIVWIYRQEAAADRDRTS